MKRKLTIAGILLMLAGCQSQNPMMSGGFYSSPYNNVGVEGPGPGVVPDMYAPPFAAGQMMPHAANMAPEFQQTSLQMPFAPPNPAMMQPRAAGFAGVPTSQINFLGLENMTIQWDARVPGTFDSEPYICPATKDFAQGNVYRLKLTKIPNRPGVELYPTLEIAPTGARTQAFLAHSTVPIEFTDNDFDQVTSGNYITKVVYLPNPEFQGIAMSGVGTLVNTQLQPGVDPIVEASKRGSILAVIRMGNKDLSLAVADRQRHYPPAGYQRGGTIPQNMISGVNIPPYGTPMTKTTTGIPGPPQLPAGELYYPNRQEVIRTEPIPAPPTVPYYAPPRIIPTNYDMPKIIPANPDPPYTQFVPGPRPPAPTSSQSAAVQ